MATFKQHMIYTRTNILTNIGWPFLDSDKERELKEGRKKARVPALPKSTSVDGSDMISD